MPLRPRPGETLRQARTRAANEDYSQNAPQYSRLLVAARLNETVALESVSWDKFQIMGPTTKHSDPTTQAFARSLWLSMGEQITASSRFVIDDTQLHRAFQQKDWRTITTHYNGSNGIHQDCDVLLESEYNRIKAAEKKP